MADNMIELVASLNVDDSAKQINTVDIPKLQKKIEGIKIKCELDTDGISSIKSQLANIKINAPQIDLGVGGGSELINNVSHIVDNVENKIEELRKNLAEKFGVSVDEIVTNTIKNAKGQINSFSFDLTKLSGEVEKFSYKVSRTKQKDKESGKDYTVTSVKAIGSRDSDKGAIQLLERATKAANTLERQMINLKAAADDVSAPRPITSQESIDKVAQAYKNAETAVGNLRTANASTFEELNNEAKKAVDELNNVIKAQRNADTAATKLRAKPIEVVKADELSNLDKFVATISNSAIPDVTNLTRRVEELRSELSEVNDKQGLVDYLNKFANVESDFKALVAQAKAVKGALRDLDSLSNNALFQKNKSDPQVSSTLSDIENIRKEYSQLFAEIGNAKTPEDLQKISNKLAELKPQFDKVVNSANQFKTALKAENIDAGLANRIKRLTADINSYAVANKRAVESTKQMSSGKSFADEWSRITSVMAKGADLADGELKDLSADMAVFRKEAQAAGLAGASAFEKFGNAFKLVSTYISANQVINMVTRNIREAVDELKVVDDRLTEISKTSDRTAESLRNLGNASFDTASKYGRTASDYLLGVQEMSRAGFGEKASEDMAELSVLAQAAGDMTADLANEYLIATNAAYQYGGSVDKLNDSLDRQNYVTNHYALSMSDLAEATKIAASQAAQSGIGIDEMTAALSTMISTTQQGGEIAARSLRGILMNIQQVKGEVGDGESDITVESLSKYEKAAADLGVSLKEVRNGAVSLRNPMIVLDELATAFNKEADDSIKKANLISAIGGKYRGNQLSALLTNWDTYKDILNTFNSEQAVGSALSEAEKSANNWVGSLNKVKNSWSELVNSFINSDNAITVIQSVDKIIQNLTDSATTGGLKTLSDTITGLIKLVGDLTDKFGTFPTLLASVGAVGSFNKIGFFKVVEDDATKGGNAVALFGKKLKDVIKDYQEADAGRIGENKISQALSGIIGFSQSDLSAIEKYNSLIESGVDKTVAFEKSMVGASNGAKSFVQSGKAATVSVTGLSISEKAATIATEALGVALNTALSFGIGLLIQAIITGITKLVNAEKEAEEKAREMQEQAAETARNYLEEKQSLGELTNEYVSLATTTSDLASQKQKLLDIQDKMNESISTQTDKVDLLNKSLAENLKLTAEQEYANAKATVSELSTQAGVEHLEAYSTKEAEKVRNKIEREFLDILNAEYGDIATVNGDYWYAKGWTLEERVESYQAIINLYSEWEGHNNDILDQMNAIQRNAKEIYENQTKTNEAYNKAVKIVEDYDKAYNSDLGGRVGEILESARDLSVVLSESDSAAEKYDALQNIENLELQARNLAGTNEVLRQQVDSVFNTINTGSQSAIKSVEDLRSAWLESLDEMQKGSFKNVDTIKTALQSVAEGNYLSSADFWGLAELDVDHILDGAQLVGDKFQVTEEQLIKLKDTYIQKQIEQLRIQNQTLQDQIDGTNGVNEGLKQQLEFESLILEAQIAKGVNSTGDARLINEQKARVNSIKDSMRAYGEEIGRNNLLIKQLNGSLGDTVDRQQAINQLAKKFQEEADNRLKAQEYKVDQIVDGIEAEKSAIEDAKTALEDQLSILKEQEDELKEITENYEKVADTVQSAIKEQIDNLKAQNEEREEALSLAEKLANLENAKNNKVRTYTEAGGWQYEAKKSDVEKAQREVDKAKVDQEIKVLEEYLKKWEDVTGKRQKAEDEQLAEQILGADWRQKIAKQDEGIFNKYEEEYESYGNQLNRISNIEMQTLQKEIDIKNKEIAAKEAQIKEWQKYKSAVQKAASDAKAATSDWYQYLSDITLNEDSTLDERNRNLEEFASTYGELLETIAGYTSQIGDMSASISFDTSGLRDAAEELEEFFNAYREGVMAMADAYNADDNHFGLINSEWDAKLLKAAKGMQLVHSAATGRVVDYTGLLAVHGTKQKSETIFNANDSKKLYDYIHNTPNVMADMITGGFKIAQNLPKTNNATSSNAVTFNGTTINLPNVQNAEQFARQMEAYMQTVLTESQVYKPRR